jgi:hypothetical protein
VRADLQAAEEAEGPVVAVGDASDLEDVVRADGDAVGLALAPPASDDGPPGARRGVALLARARGIAGRALGLLRIAGRGRRGGHRSQTIPDTTDGLRAATSKT